MARLRRRHGPVLFDLMVTAGVAALTGLGIFMRETPPDRMVLGYAMTAAILFRRRFPLSTMAAIGFFALLQVIIFPPTNDPLPFDLAVLVAMYSTVKYGRQMVDAYLAAGVVATGIVIEVARHFGPNWWALALFYVGVCGGVWLMAWPCATGGCTSPAWKSGRPPWNGSSTTWPASPPPTNGPRSPVSCTTWWRTASLS
jgi:hypothetical protein